MPAQSWLAHVDGEQAGEGTLEEHGPAFFVGHVQVGEAFCRRGIGRGLFAQVVEEARERGAPSLVGYVDGEAGLAFARAVGATVGHRDIRSVLNLRDAELPEPPANIELQSWLGEPPADIAASLRRAWAVLDEVPTPEGASWPEPHYAGVLTTAALENGEVVAFSSSRVAAPEAAGDMTGTTRAARGRGLAYVVKAANLRQLRDEHPEIERIGTWNAEQNAAIRALNAKLGFVPVATATAVTLALR